jgi:arginyl-tRNA synthetase
MYTYLENLFYPIFDKLCQKYNITYDDKINLIVKGKFGEYQFNGVAVVSKQLEDKLEQFVNELLEQLKNNDICDLSQNKIFINIIIKKQFISKCIHDTNIGNIKTNNPKNILIDYSSPNIAKELHVGHLRSTIIGDSLANLYEFMGHKVYRINHIGDWGMQFGMVIAYAIKNNLKNDLVNGKTTIDQLMTMYQEAKQLSKEDEQFKKEVKKYVLLLQAEDNECINLWKKICQISKNDYEEVYKILNINSIQEMGESTYNQFIPTVIEKLKQANLLIESDGAQIIETLNQPLMVVKSDKGYTYDTTDLAALWFRTQKYSDLVGKFNEILYLTDAGQRTHFENVFEVGQKMGWLGDCQCKHIGFGLVLKDGKKISSRKKNNDNQENKQEHEQKQNGKESIKLRDLLDETIEQTKIIWMKKEQNIDENDIKQKYVNSRDQTGYIDMAINSIKYFDFKYTYQSNYNFNKEQVVQFDSNTAAYVMYRYAQINNVLKQKQPNSNINFDYVLDVEKSLILKIFEFEHTINYALKEKQLKILVDYIYSISQNFSSMWNCKNKQGHIIGSEYESSRLLLCTKLKKIYEDIFGILGLKLLDSV